MCDNCGCGKMAETFRAPYAGSDALSSIDFSKAQITNIIGTGDFDHASLNSSGHQNIFANAESFDAEYTSQQIAEEISKSLSNKSKNEREHYADLEEALKLIGENTKSSNRRAYDIIKKYDFDKDLKKSLLSMGAETLEFHEEELYTVGDEMVEFLQPMVDDLAKRQGYADFDEFDQDVQRRGQMATQNRLDEVPLPSSPYRAGNPNPRLPPKVKQEGRNKKMIIGLLALGSAAAIFAPSQIRKFMKK